MNINETDNQVAEAAAQAAEPTSDSTSTSKPETPNPKSLPKIISFETLTRCGEEIWIENNGQIYRLRKTRQGRLILTK
ncbi:hemin uptake protein HemP [Saprospiraceae bacterium]|nr:hemin uptake protein HemP [Saprospiraceae bacterium]